MGLLVAGQDIQAQPDWQFAMVHQDDSMIIRMRFLPNSDPVIEKWIGFEILNISARVISLHDIYFDLFGSVSVNGSYNPALRGGVRVSEGAWLFQTSDDPQRNQFGRLFLNPNDKVFCWRYISEHTTAGLLRSEYAEHPNMEEKRDRQIRAVAKFRWQSNGRFLEVESDTFSFDWRASRAGDLSALRVRLDTCLNRMHYSGNYELLGVLLKDSIIANSVPLERYIEKVKSCTNSFNMQTLLRFLSINHADNDSLVQFFIREISENRLTYINNYWSPRYVEPLAEQVEKSGAMNALQLLSYHYEDWRLRKDLGSRLAKCVFLHWPILLHTDSLTPENLYLWHYAAQYLSMARDSGSVTYFEKLLRNKLVCKEYSMWDFSKAPDFWPATRVCDVAFEAILRIQGRDLTHLYRSLSGLTPEDYYKLIYDYQHPKSLNNPIRMEILRNQAIAAYLAGQK